MAMTAKGRSFWVSIVLKGSCLNQVEFVPMWSFEKLFQIFMEIHSVVFEKPLKGTQSLETHWLTALDGKN